MFYLWFTSKFSQSTRKEKYSIGWLKHSPQSVNTSSAFKNWTRVWIIKNHVHIAETLKKETRQRLQQNKTVHVMLP